MPCGRRDGGRPSPGVAAQAVGASRATGYRWWRRYGTALGGAAGAPVHPQAPAPASHAPPEILAARTRSPSCSGRCWGAPPRPWEVLRRLGHSRRPRAPRPPVLRGARVLHLAAAASTASPATASSAAHAPAGSTCTAAPCVAVDDHSRLAYAEVRPSDRRALAFLDRALAWFRSQGIAVQAVMTDNGPAYRAHAWRRHCAAAAPTRRRSTTRRWPMPARSDRSSSRPGRLPLAVRAACVVRRAGSGPCPGATIPAPAGARSRRLGRARRFCGSPACARRADAWAKSRYWVWDRY